MNYIFIDAEMGGRGTEYSLLSAAFIVTDENFDINGELYLKVKPDDGNYIVSAAGLKVNNINLVEHDEIAIKYKHAKHDLYSFLHSCVSKSKEKLVPVGHGVKGDISHVLKYLISTESWQNFCTYHYMDTSVLLQYLRATGKISKDIKGDLESLSNYFNVSIGDLTLIFNQLNDSSGGQLHDALVDARVTMEIFKKMVELGR